MGTEGISPELERKRREWLQRSISNYLKQGYRVVSQTEFTAQMVKPRSFGCLWLTISLLSLGLGLLLYLFWARDQTVYLDANKIN